MIDGSTPGARVGARVRALRAERGLSLSALATSARIGKGSLSELETGRRNPTLETLYALAGPLGVPLAALLDDRDGLEVADHSLAARRLHVLRGDAGTTEVYLIRVSAGGTRHSPAHALGVSEQLIVLAGAGHVDVAGAPRPLGPGDHLAWLADVPHSYTADAGADLVALDVIVTPATRR